MKVAISLPDELFQQAERLAERWELARSELYRRALEEYLAKHARDRVTQALDRLSTGLYCRSDAFVSAAGRRTLNRTKW